MRTPLHRMPGAWLLAALVVATLALFYRVLPGDVTFLERDMLLVSLPAKAFWAAEVARGNWPDWYPHDGLGQPFAGAVVTGAFHPGNLLFLLLDAPDALELLVLLCYPIAGLGAWLAARAWGTSPQAAALAACYALCGYLVSMTNNLPYLLSATALPWAVWAALRLVEEGRTAWAATTAVALSLTLLAGDPQAFAIACGTVLVLGLAAPRGAGVGRRRALVLGLLAVGLAGLLSGAQLAAAWNSLGESFGGRRTPLYAMVWSVDPLRALDVLVGPLFSLTGFEERKYVASTLLRAPVNSLWAPSLYLGPIALLLAATGLVARGPSAGRALPLALVLAAGVLALGRHTPVYGWLYDGVPLWRAFRYPEKLFPHVALWTLVLAARGLDAALLSAQLRRRLAVAAAALGLALLVSASLAQQWVPCVPFADAPAGLVHELVGTWRAAALVSGLASLGLAAVLGSAAAPSPVRSWAVAGLCAIAMVWAGQSAYSALPRELAAPPAYFFRLQDREGGALLGRARVYSDPAAAPRLREAVEDPALRDALLWLSLLLPDAPALWDAESAGGYLPAMTARSGLLLDDVARWRSVGAAVANVGYAAVGSATVPEGAPPVAVLPSVGMSVVAVPGRAPRVYMARPRCAPDVASAAAALDAADFVPGRDVVLECTTPPVPAAGPVSGTARLVTYSADRVVVSTEVSAPAVLVLTDAYASGWSARVDGEEVPVLPANVAFRAVVLPAGARQVEFTYVPPLREAGLAGSGAGLALCMLAWVRGRRRRAPAASESQQIDDAA